MKPFAILMLAVLMVGCSSDPDSAARDRHDSGDVAVNAELDEGSNAEVGGPDAGADLVVATDTADPAEIDRSPLDVMDRPAKVVVPDDYDPSIAYPLIVLLHGYTATGDLQDLYLGLGVRSTERGFILVKPDGTQNPEAKRFWNAMWCCDFYGQNIDDVGYISALIAEAKARFNVDAARVYVVGHSNGGFMAYRMACEVDGIAAIVSLAGSGWLDENDCLVAGGPVSVLHVHGTLDATIPYDGVPLQYPGAREMVGRWVGRDGCDPTPTTGAAMDLETTLLAEDTTPEEWSGCDESTTVMLWTIENGGHIPSFRPAFIEGALDFLFSHASL